MRMSMKSVHHLIIVSLVWSVGASAQFKIAWLSDTHIGFAPAPGDLRAVVADINERKDEFAFVVISGDITEKGKNDELKLAKQILDSLQLHYFIVPGNHDTKWSESGCTMFGTLFGDDKAVYDYKGYRFIGLNDGIPMRGGGGHIAPQDLRWLDSVLVATPASSKIVFVCHHLPDGSDIDNTDELLNKLKKHDLRFIGIGHGHANRKYNWDGIEGVMFRSTLARNAKAAYTIVELREDSIIVSEKNVGEAPKSPWHRFANQKKNYEPSKEKGQPFINSPNVSIVWDYKAGVTIGTKPEVSKENVFVTDAQGNAVRLSLLAGKIDWQVNTGNSSVYSSPVVSENTILFGTSDGTIQVLNTDNGSVIWNYKLNGSVLSCPTVQDGKGFIGASDGKFRAFDVVTGKLLWEFSGIGENVETKPLVYEGKVLFGSWDAYLYALDVNTGSLLWKWSADKPNFYFAPAACWPVAANGKIFVAAPDKFTTAIDAMTGKTVWRTNEFAVWESIGISADGERLYLRGMTDTLYCVSTASATPKLLWKTDCKYGFDSNPSMPMEKDGVVFFGSKSGIVSALDAKTGAIRWQYDTGKARTNTVTPLDAQGVVVTTMDGDVLYLREAK